MRLLLLLLLLIGASGYAQSTKKKKKSSSEVQASPTSVNPNTPSSGVQRKSSNKKKVGSTHDSERDYYERKEELAKTRRKNERMAEKPQYSDPMYFGHKRPPKKKPASKMKFCKECGIRH